MRLYKNQKQFNKHLRIYLNNIITNVEKINIMHNKRYFAIYNDHIRTNIIKNNWGYPHITLYILKLFIHTPVDMIEELFNIIEKNLMYSFINIMFIERVF